jgi:Uma2 family endonuclease
MATVATKPMTADEFFDFANRPENMDKRFELERGEIVEMSLPGERHCVVCGNVAWVFGNYTRQLGRGRVCPNDMGLILERDPDTVRGPDVAVYLSSRRYDELQARFPVDLPELIVEVISPNDRVGKMQKRINQFLAKGVPLVFLVDPEGRTVSIHRRKETPQVLEVGEEITGVAELPGFRSPVADFFASL